MEFQTSAGAGAGDALSPTMRCIIWTQGPRCETSSRGLVCGAPVPKVPVYLEVREPSGTGRDPAHTIIKLTTCCHSPRTQPLGGLGIRLCALERRSGL